MHYVRDPERVTVKSDKSNKLHGVIEIPFEWSIMNCSLKKTSWNYRNIVNCKGNELGVRKTTAKTWSA